MFELNDSHSRHRIAICYDAKLESPWPFLIIGDTETEQSAVRVRLTRSQAVRLRERLDFVLSRYPEPSQTASLAEGDASAVHAAVRS